MIEIKTAGENDYIIINQLAHKIWPHAFRDILSNEQIEYMLNWMYSIPSIKDQAENKGHKFILAKEDDNYRGYASYEIDNNKLNKTKIHKIYILPEMQGKGIGKLLMEYISDQAVKNKNTSLVLNVNRNNTAVKFYERIGFKIIREEDIDIGNNFFMNDYVMEKEL